MFTKVFHFGSTFGSPWVQQAFTHRDWKSPSSSSWHFVWQTVLYLLLKVVLLSKAWFMKCCWGCRPSDSFSHVCSGPTEVWWERAAWPNLPALLLNLSRHLSNCRKLVAHSFFHLTVIEATVLLRTLKGLLESLSIWQPAVVRFTFVKYDEHCEQTTWILTVNTGRIFVCWEVSSIQATDHFNWSETSLWKK